MNGLDTQVKEVDSLIDKLEEWKGQGLAPTEIALRMRRLLEYKARMKGVPLRGTFELTPLCNLNCRMCYVHLTKQQMQRETLGLLPGTVWISIMKQAVSHGMVEATLTGGEALMHPDFDEIFQFLCENNVSVNLKSNGLLLSEERVAFLKAHHLSNLQISVYGSDDESYERVTGKRAYQQVMDAISLVRAAEIPLELVITPNKYIWPSLEKLIRMVDAMGVQYSVNPGLVEPLEETGRNGENHDLSLDQYVQMNKMIAGLKGAVLSPLCESEIPSPGGSVTSEVTGMQCAAGRSVFSVTWRGRVHPCRMMEKIGFDGLAIPFADGWREINTAVQNYPFPRECIGCDFQMVCPSCVVQHEYGAQPGHANPAICRRAQRMLAEGFITRAKEGEKCEESI